MAIDKVVSASITDSAVTDAKLSFNSNQFRNIIINGDMSIAQRGTSATGIGNGDAGYHTCDRWNTGEGGATTAEFTQSQSTDVPTGQGFANSLKMDCTTADTTLDSDIVMNITHKIEGQNLQYLKKGTSSAESVTLSFWVKSSKTGTYVVNLYDNDNTRSIQSSYTISSADTWEKKTLTFAGDTTGTFGNDSNTSLEIYFQLFAGSDYTGGSLQTSWGSYTATGWAAGQVNLADSTSNEWYITGVQLEVGTSASDFEFLPHDVNLQRCYRYFQLINTGGVGKIIGTGGSYDNNTVLLSYTWVPKRSTPSIYQVSGTGYFYFYGSGSENDAFDLWKIYSPNYLHGLLYSDDSSISLSDNVVGWFQLNNSAAVLGLNAEL